MDLSTDVSNTIALKKQLTTPFWDIKNMWFNTSIRSGVSWRSSEARLKTNTTADQKRFFFFCLFWHFTFHVIISMSLIRWAREWSPYSMISSSFTSPFLSIRELCLFRNINYFFILIFKNFKPRICQLYILLTKDKYQNWECKLTN